MAKSEEGRVEDLSRQVGGRFRLTVLVQKQAREYYRGGRAFMPNVRNLDELFNVILDEVEGGKISLTPAGEVQEQKLTGATSE
jgi:DNA-directed RNA polymerase subunit K/omega